MKKIKKILIGTHNRGKFKELSFLLPKKMQKISPLELKIKSPKETGKSFLANAKLKANYFSKHSKMTSISDDSGLMIHCLKNKPGIHSARFAKKNGGFKKAMKKIVNLVYAKGKMKKNTKAIFICSLSMKIYKGKFINAQGQIQGSISNKILGKNGFGYDSIFIPKNYKITFGQMTKKKKVFMDHRFIAYRKLVKKTNIL
jgi:XTP/dITP diphosphohydrolase